MNHKEIFTEIYKNDTWGGSGGGSLPEVTEQYRKLIQDFLKEKNIKSVVDFGCGDWMFSRYIDWSGVHYLGTDCVQSVIDANKKIFGKVFVTFKCSEHVSERGDLLILKDILQHWSNEKVYEFLRDAKKRFKYILITNTSNQVKDDQENENPHINPRPLSAKFYPLKAFSPEILMETNINEPKETCLITCF